MVKTKPFVSVLVATCDRYDQLIRCLASLSAMNYEYFDVVVIDESEKEDERWKVDLEHFSTKVRYEWHPELKGKSAALNYAASIARGEMYLFTDDDCIVDAEWVAAMMRVFSKDDLVDIVFGRTKSYTPSQRSEMICPSIFEARMPSVLPIKPHWLSIGIGNNMGIRKAVFDDMQGFQTWLGPGTRMHSGEDGELILRAQIKGLTMQFTDQAIVYHDKWVSISEYTQLVGNYMRGGIAAYAYHGWSGQRDCWPICRLHLEESWRAHILPPYQKGHWVDLAKGLGIFIYFLGNALWGLMEAYLWHLQD